ncbi:hypothetical protein [Nodularia sphaerocarpa]|uniref:hypothetical protein n=1 Tax=Nodularia sphaerocarpa TaxID=137816 RepID=UPI00232CD159|nr:hypothetical protein [Nodularia sphaerocarpa]MDB9372374.1 hypothetical protein [Nodularia sphaerocarpa CS-585]MDB9377990.1 hypothetical protein [Nodularia sphaerocarpa CS-585A2]
MLGPFKRHSSGNNESNDEYLLDVRVSETYTQSFIVKKSEGGKYWMASKGPSYIPIADGSKTPEEVGKEYSEYIKKEWEEDLKRMDSEW